MSAMDMFWAAPPISRFVAPYPALPYVLILIQCRTMAASAFFLSIAVYTGMLSGYYVIWHTPYVLQFPPQLWRLVTSFLITGKDLNIIFDTYFCKDHLGIVQHASSWLTPTTVYTYGSKLESASPRFSQPGDFMTYILFVCFTILVGIFSSFYFTSFSLAPHIICPHSAIPPTIAVPGDEEDYPCTLAGPSFAINPKGQFAV
jgi:Derlin-2/3